MDEAEFADLDCDMDVDLMVMNGFLNVNKANAKNQPDSLFIQKSDGSFVQRAEQWGLTDTNRSRGFVLVDLNDDGWLDLVQRDAKGPQDIWMARCGSQGWLRIRLRGLAPNVDAIGARVRVTVGETRMGQGREAAREFLKENIKIRDEIEQVLRAANATDLKAIPEDAQIKPMNTVKQ